MPSQLPVPDIRDSIRAGGRAIVARKDLLADTRTGAIYDLLMGTAAMAFSREALTDRDKFRAIYLTTAQNDDLTTFVSQRFGIDRVLDTYGTGSCGFSRGSASAGAGTIYAGTRLQVATTNGSIVYEVASDVSVSATQTSVVVPVQATTFGAGVAISNASASVLDTLWDNTWDVSGLSCANGTTFEAAPDFLARVKATLQEERPGYPALVQSTLLALGAPNVVLFPSQFQGGTDYGVSAAYVGDASYSCSSALLASCRAGLESARVLGCDLWIGPMAVTPITLGLTVSLWRDPSYFDQNKLLTTIALGVIQYFRRGTHAYAYKVDGIRSAIQRVSKDIETPTITSINGSAPADVTFAANPWAASMPRYLPSFNSLVANTTLTGPS